MTTPTVAQVVQMRRPRARVSLAGMLRAELRAELAETDATVTWPSARYREDPCAFAADVLGVELWEKQREILAAVRDHLRVSVRSGHKCGKSTTAAVVALWFYCSFDDARVVMSSVTARQVDQILWRETKKLHAKSGTCVDCRAAATAEGKPAPRPCPHSAPVDGTPHDLARSGLKAKDFREIVGFTAREAEAVAGISGANLLYVLDEASGITDEIFEAIEGNRAGGARVVMFSNPTRTEGEFYLSHTDKAIRDGNSRGFYKAIHVSSEETPNCREGRDVIPGLAGRAWVEEKRLEWGETSPLFKVRVRGEFVEREDGKILSVHAIRQAEERWIEACDDAGRLVVTQDEGRLVIGVDPAGPAAGGDESAFAVRRGSKIIRLYTRRGISEHAHLAEIRGLIKEHRIPRDVPPAVVLDREGPIGAAVFGLLRAFADEHPEEFQVVGLRASDRAHRQPHLYDRLRDELWANLAAWLKDGGAIPEDARLARELHAPEWIGLVTGKLKVTSKEDLRKVLGRSPDRADAVALAAWEPVGWDDRPTGGVPEDPEPRRDVFAEPSAAGLDPYAGLFVWSKR